MRKWAALLSISLATTLPGQHQTATLTEPFVNGSIPYEVELREISLAPAPIPKIHSAAVAEWQGQWVILGGRTNGLHGMTGMNAFDPAYENREVWVVDPETKQSWRKSLDDSPASGLSRDTPSRRGASSAASSPRLARMLVNPALAAGATHLLLDNMEPATLRGAVTLIGGRVKTEASGGVTLETIRDKAETGVDYISVGRLTQSAPAADIGLDFAQV